MYPMSRRDRMAMEDDATIRKGTLSQRKKLTSRAKHYHVKSINYMNLQRKLKDTQFVPWEMLPHGLYKALSGILDPKWRREFKDIGMQRVEVHWLGDGILRVFKILRKSLHRECRCMYSHSME